MKQAFINGYILDGTREMQPVGGKAVLCEDGRITSITDSAENLDGYTVYDLDGAYIMPGLINMHVHIPANGKPKKKEADTVKLVKLMTSTAIMRAVARKMCEGYVKDEVLSGVTTIRTMGGIIDIDSWLRDKIARGKAVGPRILASNMAISVPDGHMAGSLAHIATTTDEARNFVKEIAKGKPDLIKLMITGGVLDAKVKGEPGEIKMSAELVKAACDEAHAHGFKVAAHVESPAGVRLALENGVDTIEHGAKPDEEIIRLFKEKGACHIATISPALPFALFDREISGVTEVAQYNGKIVFDGVIDCAKACLEAGVPVGIGTDTGCPYITHYDMWREVNYFAKYCNVSNAFALHTATQVNAQLAGIDALTGTIEEGKRADFLITEANPLESLTALRTPKMVVANGTVYDNPQVTKFPEVEKELDKFI